MLGLWLRQPEPSARTRITPLQVATLSMAAGAFLGLAVALVEAALFLLAVALAAPLLCVVALRAAAVAELLRGKGDTDPPALALADDALPTYSVLVPLYEEVAVAPRLLKALGALDYPASRLEILLVLESCDPATRDALGALRLPSHFRAVVVPDAQPRTKPKALNFALQDAHGELVVIYDAEDIPEPDQLRRAAGAFACAAPNVACLQARLNVDEPDRNLWSRMFALEYSAHFDALLPALERWRLPVPLGGTSNHFRSAILRSAGAWDPFNVTEDADLGMRLARLGYRVGTIGSTTWEEAPRDFRNWRNQRTRWLKGWLQTYLVHTREPRRAWREMGSRGQIGLHVLMGGILLSVLAYPIGLAMLIYAALDGRFYAAPETGLETWLWWASLTNLLLGSLSSIAVAALAAARRGRAWLAPYALLLPVYWLLISLAGYRAVWQLVRDPFRWEKTSHGDPDSPLKS